MTVCVYCGEGIGDGALATADADLLACGSCFNVNQVAWSNGSPRFEFIQGLDPIRSIAPEGSVMADVLASVPAAIEALPVLPQVPQRAIAMAHDPLTSMSELAGVINEDAGLSLRMLRRANSAMNAPTMPITDVAQACAHIGLKSIVQTAQTEMNAGLYRRVPGPMREMTQALWKHNVIAAHVADRIGKTAKIQKAEEAFLAGLIHDVGKLILLDVILNVHRGRVGRLDTDKGLLASVLTQFSRWVGAHVAQHWKMTPEFRWAVLACGLKARAPKPEWEELALTVGLASDVAAEIGYDLDRKPAGSVWDQHEAAEKLGMQPAQLASIREEAAATAENVVEIAGLA